MYDLPEKYKNTKKDVLDVVRKELDKFDVYEEFQDFCDLDKLERILFAEAMDKNHDHFVLRLYVKSNVLGGLLGKVQGRFASWTQEVGAAHLAVQIADTVVHWFDGSLCLPKGWAGGGVTALFYPQNDDGEEVPLIKNTKENRMAICEVIQEWNCTKMYDAKNANCQVFAGEIFKAVGLNEKFSKWDGPVGDFLRHAGKYENQKKPIYPALVRGDKVEIEWKTHEELDLWHNQNGGAYNELKYLLKGFHRAFQMRKLAGKDCPMDSPTLLVDNAGEKLPVVDHCSYSKTSDSKVTNGTNSMSNNNENENPPVQIEQNKPKIILPSPNTPKQNVDGINNCPGCKSSFKGLFGKYKYHCNLCRQVYCSKCLPHKVMLPFEYGTDFSSAHSSICDSCNKIYKEYKVVNGDSIIIRRGGGICSSKNDN